MSGSLKDEALRYHQFPTAGKISVTPTKALANQRDLSLAYSPGVAFACEAIEEDPIQADYLTARANLVAVISNGTAVLGLGNIGALAGKPVMEGKGVLFKKFAGIDVFDIEVNETDPDKFIEIVASLEPTFGGINLEDIKAPECFEIEAKLRERMNIPVFHDDQHGTAIIASAALINALELQGKSIADVKVVASGAGAAGMACLAMFVSLGVKKENIIVCDSKGPIYVGREGALDGRKAQYVSKTSARSLREAMVGADVFLGVSKAGVVDGEMVKSMATKPLVLALANPVPEILPDEVHAVRDDVIIATGRSDYPNQVNNVLCFPYLFRGALDVGATTINREMEMAAVKALADLAKSPADEAVIAAYGDKKITYGKDYVIPKPFDPRLITTVPIAVAKAAMQTGVARRPISDMDAYREKLGAMFNRSSFVMKPIIDVAKAHPKRVVFAEGEEAKVLRAVVACVQEGICQPIIIGRRQTILERIEQLSLPLKEGEDFTLIEPMNNPYYEECANAYHELRARDGVDPRMARVMMNTRPSALAAMLVRLGYADTMICGTVGSYENHLSHVGNVLGVQEGFTSPASVSVMLMQNGALFIADTHIHRSPDAAQITAITLGASQMMQRLGITPKVALLSRSNFGDFSGVESASVMQEALAMIRNQAGDLEIDGEMRADAALENAVRAQAFPNSWLKDSANLLIMPNVEAANISYNLIKALFDDNVIGSILIGTCYAGQIMTKDATVRRIFNTTAIAVVEVQNH